MPYELEFRGRQLGQESTGESPWVMRARFTYVPRRAALGPPTWSRGLAGRAARLLGAALPLLIVAAGGYTVVTLAA